jgi:hypothetical protein
MNRTPGEDEVFNTLMIDTATAEYSAPEKDSA